MIIAIDGPSGSGKSTLAKNLAKELNYINLNSGNFYRAIALELDEHFKKDFKQLEEEDLETFIDSLELSMVGDGIEVLEKATEKTTFYPDKVLHINELDLKTSLISSIIPIRKAINRQLIAFSKGKNIVCEGRDITSVVFPNAEVKIYLDCSAETRAKRLFELHNGKISYEEELLKVNQRDKNDKEKPFGALVRVPDSKYLDSSLLTENEVFNKVIIWCNK